MKDSGLSVEHSRPRPAELTCEDEPHGSRRWMSSNLIVGEGCFLVGPLLDAMIPGVIHPIHQHAPDNRQQETSGNYQRFLKHFNVTGIRFDRARGPTRQRRSRSASTLRFLGRLCRFVNSVKTRWRSR